MLTICPEYSSQASTLRPLAVIGDRPWMNYLEPTDQSQSEGWDPSLCQRGFTNGMASELSCCHLAFAYPAVFEIAANRAMEMRM